MRAHRGTRCWNAVTPGAVFALALALITIVEPVAQASSVLTHGPRDRHWVALTFDDGWSADRCAQIANTLRARNVTATFLINGTIVRSAPKRWRAILRGFPVANHTLTHAWLTRSSEAEIRRQIVVNERVVERVLGRPMQRLLRPPYGAYDQRVLRLAGSLGYRVVLWDTDSKDSAAVASTTVVSNASRGINGSIVLMHCGPAVTPAVLGSIIGSYRARGFKFVDLAMMLGLAPPDMACRVRNVDSGVTKGSFGKAVRAAFAGDGLTVRGTCRGAVTIGRDLHVRGVRTATSGPPTLAGMDKGTVVTVRSGVSLKLSDLTVRGGAADRGGGIVNRGELVLRNVIVRGNEARDGGGGIVNDGDLVLRDSSSVRGNTARAEGGGILNGGSLALEDTSVVTHNHAGVPGGGVVNRGTITGVRCGENVHDNVPDDCLEG
jgi:peptidoglycan/xylan/chitin deacetylase (PgdA/CDA1 family)